MSETKGKITISSQNSGSKSQGAVAQLHTPEGNTYTLYRNDTLPQNDPFFEPLDNQEVTINGSIEEANHYICVQSVTLADGVLLLAPAPSPSSPISILSDNSKQPTVAARRLPRKLKKQLKKQKK